MAAPVTFALADRDTWRRPQKTVGGEPMILIATQQSRRRRGGRTKYVFWRRGSQDLYYTQARDGVVFIPLARTDSDMERYYQAFVAAPLTGPEDAWLKRNDYVMVGDRRSTA